MSDAFKALYGRFDNVPRFLSNPPLLAHYTSMPVLESILRGRDDLVLKSLVHE
jgi:hypothetical protein